MTPTTTKKRRSMSQPRLLTTTCCHHLLPLVFLLSLAIFLPDAVVDGHVLLLDPPPRIEDDYLYSIGDPNQVCNGQQQDKSCDNFCGHPATDPTSPLTELEVGKPIDIKWLTNIPHAPYKYRLSLNALGDGDLHFDLPEHQLTILGGVTNADAADDGNIGYTGSFTTSVTIPESFVTNCTNPVQPCALQLWDMYYFVSCANVVLVSSSSTPSSTPKEEVNNLEEGGEQGGVEVEDDDDSEDLFHDMTNSNFTNLVVNQTIPNVTDLVVGDALDNQNDTQEDVDEEEEEKEETTTSRGGRQLLRG